MKRKPPALACSGLVMRRSTSGIVMSHVGQGRVTDKGRYALVISISAPGQAVDLHAEVANLVEVKVEALIS